MLACWCLLGPWGGACGQPLGSKILGFRCLLAVPPVLVANPLGLRFLGFRCLPGVCGAAVAGHPLGSKISVFGVFSGCGAVFVANALGLRFVGFAVSPACARGLGPTSRVYDSWFFASSRLARGGLGQPRGSKIRGFWRLLGLWGGAWGPAH